MSITGLTTTSTFSTSTVVSDAVPKMHKFTILPFKKLQHGSRHHIKYQVSEKCFYAQIYKKREANQIFFKRVRVSLPSGKRSCAIKNEPSNLPFSQLFSGILYYLLNNLKLMSLLCNHIIFKGRWLRVKNFVAAQASKAGKLF
jgi:hypothetical protein